MYTKTIEPAFKQVGKRRKLNGYTGELHDGKTLISCMLYGTYSEAKIALDALAFELLHDLAEQGLVDELPTFDPSTCSFCHKPHAAQDCGEMRGRLFAPLDVEFATTGFDV